MTKYWVSYRLHGPTKIATTYCIGEATLKSGTASPHVFGTIEFEFEAESRAEARVLATSEYQDKASRIAGILSFTFGEGVLLGDHYRVRRADAPNKAQTDATLNAGEWELDIAEHVYDNVHQDLISNDELQRALNWYNIALSTETDEDRLVAAWTGLESIAQQQSTTFQFSQQERQFIQNAKDAVLNELGNSNSDRYAWVAGCFGNILSGTKFDDDDVAVARLLSQELDPQYLSEVEEIETAVDDIYSARNNIVHEGIEVNEANAKAGKATELLTELLKTKLSDAYSDIIDSQVPSRQQYLLDPDKWALQIFEEDETLELTRNEIKRRAFALCRDIKEAYKLSPSDYTGDDQPLLKTSKDTFKLDPAYF